MGRLYWKFFIFFFLAQLTAVTGVGVAVWIANKNLENQNEQIEASPPAKSMVEAAAITLKYGGVEGLDALTSHWSRRPVPQVYAVNEKGAELKGRMLPAEVIKTADTILERKIFTQEESPSGALLFRSPVQRVDASDGHRYLLFVPALKFQKLHQAHSGPSKPSLLGFNPRSKNKHLFPWIPLLAGVIASFIFAALLAWYFSKPIKQLKQAFASAANGNLDVRVGDAIGARRDELADLGSAFDLMASRLGALMQGQTRLLHQVSHELRSPLARLQIAVGLARQQPEKSESSLARIERESDRMDALVGELLELSRLESGMMHLEIERVDLNDLLLTVTEDARFEGEAKNITVAYQQQPNLVIFGQQDLLHRAIDNVVRNALKYSPERSNISIEVASNSAHIAVSVRDQGPGVAEEELTTIFQAFFRGTKTNSADGHGVGLAIAKQIVEAHGGNIVAKNAATGGLIVELTLPLNA